MDTKVRARFKLFRILVRVPVPYIESKCLRVRDIASVGMLLLDCFLLLGGTASAGAHDAKGGLGRELS